METTVGNSSSRKLIIAYVALVVIVLAVQLSLHFLPDFIAKGATGQSLEGVWEYCWKPSSGSVEGCQWSETTFPGAIKRREVSPGSVLVLRKQFDGAALDVSPSKSVSLFIGTVSDPARFVLNGEEIGKVGEPGLEKSYAQTYPRSFVISQGLLQSKNTILVEVHPNYMGNQGLIRGPIYIFDSEAALWVSRIVIAQTLGLPLASGIILLVIFFAVLLMVIASDVWDRKLKAFLGYALTMSLYLVSLTRLPREFLSPEIGIGLHFGLRMVTEFFHLGMICFIFGDENKVIKGARFYCIALAICLFVPSLVTEVIDISFLSHFGRELYRITVALFMLPPILAIRAIFRKPREERRPLVPLAFLYSIVCVMIFSDFLAINGKAEDIYFVRFYPVLIALGYCSALWMSYSDIRNHRRYSASIGEMSTRVAHDIRSPLTAINVVAEMGDLKGPYANLLKAAVARMNGIANDLLRHEVDGADESRAVSSPDRVPLEDIIQNLVSEKRLEFEPKEVELEVSSSLDSLDFPREWAGPFTCILSNLINNSAEATNWQGRVEVGYMRRGNSLTVEVSDNGTGISEDVLKKMGAPGFSHNKEKGNGMGVYHAQKTIESWGGKLVFQSQLGSGTVASISLPQL